MSLAASALPAQTRQSPMSTRSFGSLRANRTRYICMFIIRGHHGLATVLGRCSCVLLHNHLATEQEHCQELLKLSRKILSWLRHCNRELEHVAGVLKDATNIRPKL